MSLQQGPQSSAKGKEVAEEIVLVVYSKTNERFDITAKELTNFQKMDKKIDEDPSFKEQIKKKLTNNTIRKYNAYSFHQANVCLAEAAQHKANAERARAEAEQARVNAEQARQRKEEHLAKAAKLDKLIEKDEAIIAENKKRIEALSKKTDALRKEIENDKAQIAEAVFRIEDREKELVYAREQYVANLYQNRNLITVPKSVMSQNTPPSSLQRHKVS